MSLEAVPFLPVKGLFGRKIQGGWGAAKGCCKNILQKRQTDAIIYWEKIIKYFLFL
jgi:hypothetical protein